MPASTTMVTIAHGVEFISRLCRIIVLDAGRIIRDSPDGCSMRETEPSEQPWRLQAFRPQTRKILYSIVWRKFRALWMGQQSKLHTECRVESNDWAFVMCRRHNRPVSTPSVCLLVLRSFYTTSSACIPLLCFSGTLLSEGVWDKTIDGGAKPRKRHGKCRDRGPCAPKTTGPIPPPH